MARETVAKNSPQASPALEHVNTDMRVTPAGTPGRAAGISHGIQRKPAVGVPGDALEQEVADKVTRSGHDFSRMRVHADGAAATAVWAARARAYTVGQHFQPKLAVGPVDDVYEREADAVAEQVVNGSLQAHADLTGNEHGPGSIQRKCAACEEEGAVQRKPLHITQTPHFAQREAAEEEENTLLQAKPLSGGTLGTQRKPGEGGGMVAAPQVSSQIARSRGGGMPLGGPIMQQMQLGFGHDFGQVRIHTGDHAALLSGALNARAFTVGNDIFFGAGQYQPRTREGQRLLAHELTHTLQQGGERRRPIHEPLIQRRNNDDEPKIPFHIWVEDTSDQEQFKAIVIQQIFNMAPPGTLVWTLNKTTYGPKEDVLVMVQADLVNASRNRAAEGQGIGVDRSGRIEGANKRAATFLRGPDSAAKRALMAEIDRRYYTATGIDPSQKIKATAADAGRRDLWNQIRDEVLFQNEYLENLPDEVKLLVKITRGGKPITAAEIDKLFNIAKKIEGMDPISLLDYASKVNVTTTDLDVFEASLDTYLQEQAIRKQEDKTRRDAQDKLAATDDLYDLYKKWKEPVINVGIPSQDEAGVHDPNYDLFVKREHESREKALLDALSAKGFASLAEYQQYLQQFVDGFQTEAVNIILDTLARYEGTLYKESQRYKDPEELTRLGASLEAFRQDYQDWKVASADAIAKADIVKGKRERSRLPGNGGTGPTQDEIASADAAASKATAAKDSAIANVDVLKPRYPVLGEDHLPVNRRIDKVQLAEASADTLGPLIQDHIAERIKDIHAARARLIDDPEMVFKMEEMMPSFFAKQGIAQDGVLARIIKDKISDIHTKEAALSIVLAILAIALAVASYGAATPWIAAAAAAGGLGISGYAVYDEYHKYVVQKDLADVGMADDPSVAWLIVAVVGAALDMAAAVKAVQALGPAAKAIKAGGTLDEFTKTTQLFAAQGKSESKIARAAEAAARSRQAYLDASAELSKAMSGKLYSFPGPLLDPDMWGPLLKMAKAKVSQAGSTLEIWLAELNTMRMSAKLAKLDPAEVEVARKAWMEAKALSEAMDQAAAMVPEFRAGVLRLIGTDARFVLELTDEELKLIIAKGREVGMSTEAVRDLVFAGSRVNKRASGLEILAQIDFYQSVLKRGFPAKFSSVDEFLEFSGALKKSFGDAGLQGGEVRVFGSSLTKPTARNVDFCIVYNEVDFENVLKAAYKGKIKEGGVVVDISHFTHADFVSLAARIEANPKDFTSVARSDFSRNFADGMVRAMAGKRDPERVFGLKGILSDLQKKYPHLDLDDFMILQEGSRFDRMPYMAL